MNSPTPDPLDPFFSRRDDNSGVEHECDPWLCSNIHDQADPLSEHDIATYAFLNATASRRGWFSLRTRSGTEIVGKGRHVLHDSRNGVTSASVFIFRDLDDDESSVRFGDVAPHSYFKTTAQAEQAT